MTNARDYTKACISFAAMWVFLALLKIPIIPIIIDGIKLMPIPYIGELDPLARGMLIVIDSIILLSTLQEWGKMYERILASA